MRTERKGQERAEEGRVGGALEGWGNGKSGAAGREGFTNMRREDRESEKKITGMGGKKLMMLGRRTQNM